jgi:hypothetical protein
MRGTLPITVQPVLAIINEEVLEELSRRSLDRRGRLKTAQENREFLVAFDELHG